MENDFPTSNDPFHLVCAYSPYDMYYYLYDVDLIGMKRLHQKQIDLTSCDELIGQAFLPKDLQGKIMYYIIEMYIRDKDPGNALEYAFLSRSTVKEIYYRMFGTITGVTRMNNQMVKTMIKRIAQTFRNLYKIAEQMEAVEDPMVTSRICLGLIHPYYHCFYNDYYNCVIYPFLVEIGDSKAVDEEGDWKLMSHEDAHVGAAYTAWCKGFENKGIWRVYDLAWPLITMVYYFDESRIDEDSFKEFYRLVRLMFGKYTRIENK